MRNADPSLLQHLSAILVVAIALLVHVAHVGASHLHKKADLKHSGFKTEPDFFPQAFERTFAAEDKSLLAPGYVFLALMQKPGKWGPRIYDHDGNLVWYGSPSVGATRITDFQPCEYLGSRGAHLCWHDQQPSASPTSKLATLRKVVVDNTYTLVRNYTTRGNHHEFHMVDNGTKFVTMDYKAKPMDLRAYCGAENGWIRDACIVEYDVQTGQETWDWCLTDHLPVYEANVYFISDSACQKNDTTPKAGLGTKDQPWDVGHLNAVDKNSNGDYIASFRHLDEILKIAGPESKKAEAGQILWTLGGSGNQFEKNFNFSRQHMVRFVDRLAAPNVETIALFNNAWEGILTPTANSSSGQVIRLDAANMKADLVHEYLHPGSKLTESRGSMQVLPNGNAFLGWGTLPQVSEYSPNGTLLLDDQFAPYDSGQYSYRAFKSQWVAYPTWPPKLVAYSRNRSEDSPLLAYASWNGATEVRIWRFYTANTEFGPWHLAATVKRTGFETQARLGSPTAHYVKVEAVDAIEKVLGKTIRRTFVPSPLLTDECDDFGCFNNSIYESGENYIGTYEVVYTYSIFLLVVLMVSLECFVTTVDRILDTYS